MKRYALWDHNRQRFLMGPVFETKEGAEIELAVYKNLQPNRKIYVVEWEIEES